MDTKKRTQRSSAGLNESLLQDFVWPKKFGKKKVPLQEQAAKSVDDNCFSKPKNGKSLNENKYSENRLATSVTHDRQEEKKEMSPSSEKACSSNISKKTRTSLTSRRLAIEAEKKRQQLEMEIDQMKSEMKRKENEIKLINMEEDLRRDEMKSLTEKSTISGIIRSGNKKEEKYEKSVKKSTAQWVDNLPEKFDEIENLSVLSQGNGKHSEDIKLLCQTLTDVLQSVGMSNNQRKENCCGDILTHKNISDRDFPYFDGNPQDWPIFIRHFRNVISLCKYTDVEIVLKLRNCLKGAAKHAVSGLMLTNDVEKIMHTLETRFGRPDRIIEMILNKIKTILPIKEIHLGKLINLSTEISNVVAIMKCLESTGHLKNPHLQRDLLEKIPDYLKLKWGEYLVEKRKDNYEVDLEDFSKWLANYSYAASQISTSVFPENKWERQPKYYNNQVRKPERLFNISVPGKSSCNYCGNERHDGNCSKMEKDSLEIRWKTVTSKKLCFCCLRKNHQKFKCRNKKQCGINGLPITIYGPIRKLNIFALCDEGSTVTLLHSEIAEKAGLSGESETLHLQWTNDDVITEEDSMKLDFNISKIDSGENKFPVYGVRTIKDLSLPSQSLILEEYPHLNGLPIHNYQNQKPSMIIGQDNIKLIIPEKVSYGLENTPIASKCKLGWSVHGPVARKMPQEYNFKILHIADDTETEILKLMRDFSSIEAFGTTTIETKKQDSEDNKKALDIMNNTIKKIGNRYEIGLLWKTPEVTLPESKRRAFQRLIYMEKKCLKDHCLATEYCRKIDDHIKKGYLRKLSPEEAEVEGPKTWYLPHFSVVNPMKKKVRIVFDAASKSHGLSLNDVLLAGPDQLQSLVKIFWPFDKKELPFVVMFRYAEQEVQDTIIQKFYVDDFVESKDTETEAIEIIEKVKGTMSLAGFEVVNWLSNSKLVQNISNDADEDKNISEEVTIQRVLGIWWNTQTDELSFKIEMEKFHGIKPTKRNILKSVMSIFDPLGMISYIVVKGKILMQHIWQAGVSWDEEIAHSFGERWKKFLVQISKVSEVRIPRCYSLLIPQAEMIELHTFSDSSKEAFAAVTYLRIKSEEKIEISLVSSKTRVAPLKPISIPRLELQGAVLGCRLSTIISKSLEIPIHRTYFWTDSTCVLGWIRSDGKKFKQFVAQRIGEIREKSCSKDWNWIPSEQNPADLATREHSTQNLDLWLQGPSFLKSSEDTWEVHGVKIDIEIENSSVMNEECLPSRCMVIKQPIETTVLPDVQRFSKFNRLIKSTATVLRAVEIFRYSISKINSANISKEKNITNEDMKKALELFIKKSQFDCFGKEIEDLKKGKKIDKKSVLNSLSVQVKHDLLLLRGRTNLSPELNENTKEPIILSAKHRFTRLLIEHYHEKYNHQGIETILNELRQKYWILNARSALKSVLKMCNKCKRERSKPAPPLMGQIPDVRLKKGNRAFVNTGMDYFGPIMVKIGRRTEKRWGVLFTCLAVRAIHLELAHTMTSSSTIQPIMRFTARRGTPEMTLDERDPSDPDDLESITPNHFLFGSSDGLGPPLPQMMDGRIIRKEWEKSRALTESFWNRWVKEYLPTLTKRSKWTNDQKPIEIGDIVLIVDDSMPRFNWKLGKVIRTHHGIDNRIRVVDVKTATQEYRRPVHKICRLEIQ
ncbi:uncharacterized protein LOC123313086 [Coccinella septempunctata]|uniref:uncharacterized protein LOC123313086 n=1 Tax=Coccinella septempunctata TaxID=41139 RepID=UPI001D09519B|nr:uncharacterized protein LOC123313086 [Coccinella septempunctata]